MCLQISFVCLLQNRRCIFIDKVETSENAYQKSCFIAEVREKLYPWFMFQLVSSGLCFKLWQFNTKINFQHNTKFLIITDRIITFKCQPLKFHFFPVNLEFGHVMVIVTFSAMYKSHWFCSKNSRKWTVSIKQILRQE